MSNYGPSDNQKFAIFITPENYDLIQFFYSSKDISPFWMAKCNMDVDPNRASWMHTGEEDGNYYTFTISKRHQQSVGNRKIETPEEIKAPWNKLNPPGRKIAFVGLKA